MQIKKCAYRFDMRQVYKGEIEEKNQAASSNSTARIILAFYPPVNCFPIYFQVFCQKTTTPLFPSFSCYFRPYIKNLGPSETYIATKDKRLHTHTFIVHINPTQRP